MLSLTGVSKTYPGGVHALQDIHLNVPRGMFGLLGPNGAGKSSLMRTIATLQQPDHGAISFRGIDILQDKIALRRTLGYLPQEFGAYPRTSAMAQYSTLMLFKEYYEPVYANRITSQFLDFYLNGRSRDSLAEQPLMYTEEQGNISYNKGPLVLYALQDIIGKDTVHQGLRNFMAEFSFQTNPLPTSRDLVEALRAVAGDEYQHLITDLFEKIVLYDVQVNAASVREVNGEYEVTVEITGQQFEANGRGEETEVPLDTWFDVALFANADEPLESATPLHIEKIRLQGRQQRVTIRTAQRPGLVALDPFHKMIERRADDNQLSISATD